MTRPRKNNAMPSIRIGDAEYPIGELSLNELAGLEAALGASVGNVDWTSAAAIRQLVWTFQSRHDATLTLEQVGAAITMADFVSAEDGEDVDPPA